mmetsp:Transcript_5495/g.12273  ORF Transcript_5495/g.12273 Transcript_5495/m.12273 type:complete len:269 (-) Transcript_5495:585-1391(-)
MGVLWVLWVMGVLWVLEDGSAQHCQVGGHTQARLRGRRQHAPPPLRRGGGHLRGPVRVEVRRAEEQLGGGGVGQVRDGGRDYVPPPGVLDVQGHAGAHGQVPHCACLGQAAHLGYLEVYEVCGAVGQDTHQHADVVHTLVDHEGQRAPLAHTQALLVREAGLLYVHVQILHPVHYPQSVVHQPARVGIAQQRHVQASLARSAQLRSLTVQHGPHSVYPVDVVVGPPAHLQLEDTVPHLHVLLHIGSHVLRAVLRDGSVKGELVPESAA